jgi:hypothetical protein
MACFRVGSSGPAMKLSMDADADPDSRSHRDAHQDLPVASSPEPGFGQRRDVRVVLQAHWKPKAIFKHFAHEALVAHGQGVWVGDDAVHGIHGASHAESNANRRVGSAGQQTFYDCDQLPEGGPGRVMVHRLGLHESDLAVSPDLGGAHVSAAEVNSHSPHSHWCQQGA